jgi:hypothetical protein
MVSRLPFSPAMVDMIIWLTVLVVLALAIANVLHATLVLGRFARHVPRAFWLPLFTSPGDVRLWLGQWRALLDSREPALVALRSDVRLVIGRHVHLAVLSNAWAIALSTLAAGLMS